jgi:hypothetical protein
VSAALEPSGRNAVDAVCPNTYTAVSGLLNIFSATVRVKLPFSCRLYPAGMERTPVRSLGGPWATTTTELRSPTPHPMMRCPPQRAGSCPNMSSSRRTIALQRAAVTVAPRTCRAPMSTATAARHRQTAHLNARPADITTDGLGV